MVAYAYIAISPNTAHDHTWYGSHATPAFHYIKIGHTVNATSGRENSYYTHNPSVFTRMLSFATILPTEERNIELKNRAAELHRQINPVGQGSTTALFLQRYCLAAYPVGDTANEWFRVDGQMDQIVALIEKLEQDADSETVPRAFDNEGEFCSLFAKIMG